MHESVTVTAARITSVAPSLRAVVTDQIIATVCVELVMLLPFEMIDFKYWDQVCNPAAGCHFQINFGALCSCVLSVYCTLSYLVTSL